MNHHQIECTYLPQEDLLESGCLDLSWAIGREVLFPEKIVQIFNQETQERINCLPATLLKEKICGVKWVSIFPPNPVRHARQNLSAVMILSEIEKGFPVAFMEGTLCSNLRVAAVGGLAAKFLAPAQPKIIGFIGTGEQAKMLLLGMKAARPSLEECRVMAKTPQEEDAFTAQMGTLLPGMRFAGARGDGRRAMAEADILVTFTSAQAPLLKATWMKPGTFYSHVGGWEDEYEVALNCQKIVCDDWETVKHRAQTLSRMYRDGFLKDSDLHANLPELAAGLKPGRQAEAEKIYFNAVGLFYIDVALAYAMYKRSLAAGAGRPLVLQRTVLFEHQNLQSQLRLKKGESIWPEK